MPSTTVNFATIAMSGKESSCDQARSGYYSVLTQRERIETNLGRRITDGENRAVCRIGRILKYA